MQKCATKFLYLKLCTKIEKKNKMYPKRYQSKFTIYVASVSEKKNAIDYISDALRFNTLIEL